MTAPTVRASLLLVALLLLALAVYSQGLSGPFVFDDIPNLVDNNRIVEVDGEETGLDLIRAALSSDAGPLKRPLSMLSFGLNVYVFGMDPWAMKLVNVLIHLLCGAAIFALCRTLLHHWLSQPPQKSRMSADGIALFATAIWLLHPMQLTSVLYIVQRMTSLSTLFTVLGLLAYAQGRTRGDLRGFATAVGGVTVFGLLAVLSKESGALIVAYALAIELCVFGFASPDRRVRLVLLAGYPAFLLLPALAAGIYFLVVNPGLLERAYIPREFTLGERLLTQPRILWQYLGEIALPLPSRLGLYHDEIPLSTSLLQPWTTLPSLLVLLGAAALSIWQRRQYPVAAFAVTWFLAGHLMESTVVPLELKFEHRNYLSLLGPAVWLTWLLAEKTQTWRPVLFPAIGFLLVGCLTYLTAQRVLIWNTGLRFALSEAAHNPRSSRANYQAGLAIIQTTQRSGLNLKPAMLEARPYFKKAMDSWPNFELGATGMILTYQFSGETPPELIGELAARLRRAHNPTPDAVKDIIIAQGKGHLAITADQVISLLEALLENPRAGPAVRASTMNTIGAYQFNHLRNPQAAVTWTLAAAEELPQDPIFRINVAKLALVLNRRDIAARYIEEAARLDRIDLWEPEIAKVRAELAVSNAQH